MTVTRIAAIGLLLVLAVIMAMAFASLPDPGDRLAASTTSRSIIEAGTRDTNSSNIVTAVLFDYRGFDTLGEVTVVFAAVAGVALVFSRAVLVLSRKGLSPLAKESMSILTPFIMVLGFYVIFYGHISPGGGFQGGVILASWAILACLVYGVEVEERVISLFSKMVAESAGAISFVVLASIGLMVGQEFLTNLSAGFPEGSPGSLLSGGSIPYLNLVVGIKVAVGLSVMFVTMSKRDVLH